LYSHETTLTHMSTSEVRIPMKAMIA